MTGLSIHDAALGYGCVAVLVAVAVMFHAERHWTTDPPSGVARFGSIALLGALWPMLVLGVGQMAVISLIAHRLRPDRVTDGEPVAAQVPH